MRSSLEKGGSSATLCLAKTHRSRRIFAIWYPRSVAVKNRANRCGETCANAGLFDRRFADICSENLERNARFHVVQEFHQADGDRISFLARGAPGHPDPDGILGPSILNQRGEYPLLQFLEDRWFPKECGDGDKTA